MKIFKNIALVTFLTFTMLSCELEPQIESTITEYAVIDYDEVYTVPLGGTYDPVVTASEAGNDIEVTSSGAEQVDVNTVGVYEVNYSATNSDGFPATVTQTVVVHDPSIVGTDVSGLIWDKNNNSRTGVITLVEGTTSIFLASDFGFSGVFPVYFQMDGDQISEIPQPYIFGVESVDLTYDPSTMEFTTLINPQGFAYTFEYRN